jgi:uncharacterized protein YggT (Ycf19 family)
MGICAPVKQGARLCHHGGSYKEEAITMATIILHNALTLCMMGVLFRWTAPYLEVNFYSGYFRWLPRATDPLIGALRQVLPQMGAFDFGPLAAIVALWILRIILTGS